MDKKELCKLYVSDSFVKNGDSVKQHLLSLLGVDKIENAEACIDINGNYEGECWKIYVDPEFLKAQPISLCIEILRICQKATFLFTCQLKMNGRIKLSFFFVIFL